MPNAKALEKEKDREYQENPNPNTKIGFVIFYPFQFFVFKNIYKHMQEDSEFIVDLGAFFPTQQMPDVAHDIIKLLQKHNVHFRILHYEDYYNHQYLEGFFSWYEVIVSLWQRGCLRLACNQQKKKVCAMYGAGKDLTTFGLWRRNFDLILSYGIRDHSIFSLYTHSEIVGNPKFDDWFNDQLDHELIENIHRNIDRNKKTVLYLPTHGDLSSIDDIADAVKNLANEFNVISKLHYYTVREEPERIREMQHSSALLYKDDTDLLPLLRVADVVVSDNSSVIFDAILADKPLVLADFLAKEYLETEHKRLRKMLGGSKRALTYPGSIEQRIKKEKLVSTITEPGQLSFTLREALEDKPFFQNARKRLREELFSFNDGKSGERAATAIRELMRANKSSEKPLLFHLINEFKDEIRNAPSTVPQPSQLLETRSRFDQVIAEKLKRIIHDEGVLVTKEQQRIISPKGTESNWLVDFRRAFLNSRTLDSCADVFWKYFEKEYPFQVGGQETAALPLIAAILIKGLIRGKPVNGFYIRKSRKKEGLQNLIEGGVNDQKIILIDDLINTGATFARQIKVLESLGRKPEFIFALLRFREPSYYAFLTKQNIGVITPIELPDLGIPLVEGMKPSITPLPFKVLWYFQSKNPNFFYVVPKSAPVLDDEKLYFGSDNGYFWALRQQDGTVAWQYKVGWNPKNRAIFSTPAIHRNTVYFGAYDGNVYALDTVTGKPRWIFMEADWVESSPIIVPELNLLIIGVEFGLMTKRGGLIALDLETGKKRWECISPKPMNSSPSYYPEKKIIAIGNADRYLYLLRAQDGKMIKSFQLDGEIMASCAFDNKRNSILCGTSDGNFYAIDIESGRKTIQFQTAAPIYSTPLVSGDHAIVSSLDKHIYCLNLDSGEQQWVFQADRRIFASPVMISCRIYIGANDGRLYEINPETGKTEGFFQATERITNKVAYNERTKRFFLPTYANEIYCLERIEELN